MAISDEDPVGVLGGTFDPVHKGHLAIAKSFLGSKYINFLLILLTPHPPHKSGRKFAGYNQRLKMLMSAFKQIEGVKVSDLEFTLPKPSYTYQTMRYLKKSNPETKYYYCLGEDSYQHFKNWYKWKGILEYCDLLVAERPNVQRNNEDLLPYSHFIEHSPLDVSSSQIRENLEKGRSIKALVPAGVAQIIEEEKLYQ